MKKKVIDIFSPKDLEKKKEKEIFRQKKEETRPEESQGLEAMLSKPSLKIGPFFIIGLLLFLAGAFVFFYLSKANIEIWPKTDNLSLETKLTIDKGIEAPNFSAKTIPGEIFEKEKSITENFPASGKVLKDTKAEGTIKIYNEYSTSPQVLVATTRFVSADGKVFRIPVKVTVPGGELSGGKLVAGEVETKAVADKAGSEYNIAPTTFSIPGFAGSDKYTKIYAKSFQAMTGGSSGEVAQITKEDLENAKNLLVKRAKEECETALKSDVQTQKIPAGFDFLEKAIQTEIVETFTLAIAGDQAQNFNYQVKAKSNTLLFKKEDFTNFSNDFIEGRIPEGKTLYEPSLKIEYTPETINLKSGKIILSLDISGKIYLYLDLSDLKNNLKGKTLEEANEFLGSQPTVEESKVDFWPFWVKKAPQNINKINLILNID